MTGISSKKKSARLVAVPPVTAEDQARFECGGFRSARVWVLEITAMSPDIFFALLSRVWGVGQFRRQNDDGSITISVLFHCRESDPVIIVSDRPDVVATLIGGFFLKKPRKPRER